MFVLLPHFLDFMLLYNFHKGLQNMYGRCPTGQILVTKKCNVSQLTPTHLQSGKKTITPRAPKASSTGQDHHADEQ